MIYNITKWSDLLLVLSLYFLTIGCQAQENQQEQISSSVSKNEAQPKFPDLTLKELIATIDQASSYGGIIGDPITWEEDVKEKVFLNLYIDFTTYQPIQEFSAEQEERLEKVSLLKNNDNTLEILYYLKEIGVLSAIFKDTKVYKFVQMREYREGNFDKKARGGSLPTFGYIICSKPDSLCFCIDYDSRGATSSNFPVASILAIKKLNFISLNVESALYFNTGKLVKNFDCVYQDSTSKYPRLFQYYQEKYLKDDFVLKDDTKVVDILAILDAKNHTGNLLIKKYLLSVDAWIEKRYIKMWGVRIGTDPSELNYMIKLPEK